jgi:hypothetical protein
MNRAVILVLIGVAVLLIGSWVELLARDTADHLLGSVAILGGVAIVIVALPGRD